MYFPIHYLINMNAFLSLLAKNSQLKLKNTI